MWVHSILFLLANDVSAFSLSQSHWPFTGGWISHGGQSLSNCRSNHFLGLSVVSQQASDDVESMEEVIILDEFDEDFDADAEGEYEIDPNQKEEWMEELRQCARTTATDPSAVAKSQEIFDQMFEAYVLSEETSMWPSVEVYNLLLEIQAFSRDPEGADHAEKLLTRMEDESVEFIARPNEETYLKVMDAWAMRKNPTKVEEILRRMEKRYESTENKNIQPTVNTWNKVIKAYGMTGDVEKAEEIFVFLHEKEDNDVLCANYKSWVQILRAFASQPDGHDKFESLLRDMNKELRMGHAELKPKIDVYNTQIRVLSQKPDGPDEVETLLFDLVSRYRSGEKDVRPNANTFRSVLTAQRRRKNISAAKVEQLLQIQEGLYKSSKEEDLALDGRQYNAALFAISRSRDVKKASRARRIVDKIADLDEPDQLNVRTYFNLLSACAFTSGSPEENLEAFQIAVDALKELREKLDREPDSRCFGMFLKACANLMPQSRKRDAVVENVFRKCCKDGLVDEFVLAEFERASSEALQLEILGGFLDDDVRIPNEWSKHVEETEES